MTTNREKKGFSSQAKRFLSRTCQNENPGPGSYHLFSNTEVISPSFSKKGTTGFVGSKAVRKPLNGTPGPNTYNLLSSFINKYDFNNGASRMFRLPVAVQMDGPKHKIPAPNYDISCTPTVSVSSVVDTSSFLSRTSRDSLCPNKTVPSPGHYNVSTSLLQHGSSALLSPFSKTQRILSPVHNDGPGPAGYSPYQAPTLVKMTILPRGFYLALLPLLLAIPKAPPLLGPGQYNIGNHHQQIPKHSRPTAAFASRTERIQKSHADMTPGPGKDTEKHTPEK
ncbi:LOW QUALITY PROTEIN: O(6)-methylguanine-induced apoptosis 2 [Pholidichthys leucotaenia]